MKKKTRILYVCPWAHWHGHPPNAARVETLALLKAGAEVFLCTFRGIHDQNKLYGIPHNKVTSNLMGGLLGIVSRLLHLIRPGRNRAWLLERFLEYFATLLLAIRLKKSLNYDLIYLRDGDPFIFIPFFLGFFLKHYNWAIHIIGAEPVLSPGSLLSKFANAHFWKPIYHRSLCRNRFALICENRHIADFYKTNFLDGAVSGNIHIMTLGVERILNYLTQKEARRYLGLPEDKIVFLHFGALHHGKDIETVLSAVKDLPDALLVHAGKISPSIGLTRLVSNLDMQNCVIIRDYYIPEIEKPYYFSAADAIILSYKRDFIQTASMILEGAKFKLPIIASDNGELGEQVKRYGMGSVFHAEDAVSLKVELSHFLGLSQNERETIATNCEKFCDDFSINGWAQRYINIFDDLCDHNIREC